MNPAKRHILLHGFVTVFFLSVSTNAFGQLTQSIHSFELYGSEDSLSFSLSPFSQQDNSPWQLESDKAFTATNISLLGEWSWGPCHAVGIVDQYGLIGCGSFIQTLDISDPSQPIMVGEIRTMGFVHDIEIVGEYAYVACGLGLEIFDISNPKRLISVGAIDLDGYPPLVRVSGRYAYVGGQYVGRVIVIDITDPYHPRTVAMAPGSWDRIMSLEVAEGYLYVGTYFVLVDVFDVSDPENPKHAGYYPAYSPATDLKYINGYLFGVFMENPRFRVIDVSMPYYPQDVCTLHVEDDVKDDIYKVDVEGNNAYLCTKKQGLLVVDFSEFREPKIVARIDKPPWYITPRTLVIDHNHAYVAANTGLWVFDVSNPEDPVDLTFYPTGDRAWDVAVSGEYAYVACGYAGLWVIDVSDPSRPRGVGHLGTAWATDVIIDRSNVYLATSGGLLVIDVSDPMHPKKITRWFEKVNDMTILNGLLFAARSDTGLSILSIHSPDYPEEVGFFPCRGLYHVDVSGCYAYLADSDDGLKVVKIIVQSSPT